MGIAFDVLRDVWGDKTGYVFIPRRKGKTWDEGRAFQYPEELNAMYARINGSVDDGWDVYWCPLVFSAPVRQAEHVLPEQSFLWADLDDVDPRTLGNLTPTIAWKSSTSRYQGLWRLDGDYPVETVEPTNRNLTYTIGADKGGWDLTQVLRVPGTPNHKYDPPQEGALMWNKSTSVSIEQVASLVVAPVDPLTAGTAEPIDVLLKPYDIPQRAKTLLAMPADEVEVGERSDRLWELETLLAEAGVPVITIIQVVKQSVWNKYAGRRDEDKRLFTEALKAEQHVRSTARTLTVAGIDPTGDTLKEQTWAIPFPVFMTTRMSPPTWLVEYIWQTGTYGMLAGEPKTFKSVLSTDLALSVAGGQPFLGKFEVPKPGAVLYVQEENNPQTIQDRVVKVAQSKGLTEMRDGGIGLAKNLPLYFSNNYGIDLTHKDSRVLLEKTIKDIMPALVIFDPFYMMLGAANENDATEMRNTLHWLSMLRNKYGVAILVLHHYNKSNGGASRGGQKIRGTSEFHAWVESALYVKTTGTPGSIKIEREFRAYPMLDQLDIGVEIGEPGYPHYRPEVTSLITSSMPATAIKKDEIISVLLGNPRTFDDIKTICKLSRPETQRLLNELKDEGVVVVDEGGGRGHQTKYHLKTGAKALGDELDDVFV